MRHKTLPRPIRSGGSTLVTNSEEIGLDAYVYAIFPDMNTERIHGDYAYFESIKKEWFTRPPNKKEDILHNQNSYQALVNNEELQKFLEELNISALSTHFEYETQEQRFKALEEIVEKLPSLTDNFPEVQNFIEDIEKDPEFHNTKKYRQESSTGWMASLHVKMQGYKDNTKAMAEKYEVQFSTNRDRFTKSAQSYIYWDEYGYMEIVKAATRKLGEIVPGKVFVADVQMKYDGGKTTIQASTKKWSWKQFKFVKYKTYSENVNWKKYVEKDIKSHYYQYKQKYSQFQNRIYTLGKWIQEMRALNEIVQFNKDKKTVFPAIDGKRYFLNGYHPLIENCVPNDSYSDTNKRVFLIKGPNKNGKSTFMNMNAINSICGQLGIPIYADKGMITPLDHIISHYIRGGDIHTGESRYENELRRIKEITQQATSKSLVLLNETATGTSYEDGTVELKAFLKALHRIGATVYAETHFHEVADVIEELPHAYNLHCHVIQKQDGFDYTYKILPGTSTQSEGQYLARQLGADEKGLMEIIDRRIEAGELIKEHTKDTTAI